MGRARVMTAMLAVLAITVGACGSRVPIADTAADTAGEHRQDPPADALAPPSPAVSTSTAATSSSTGDRPADVPEPRPTEVEATGQDVPSPAPAATPAPASRTEPPYGDWLLVASRPEVGEPDGEQTRLAVLEESGRLLARADTPCNTGGADLTVDGDRWSLGPYAASAMGCPEPRVEAEETFVTALTSVTHWRFDDDVLTLTGPDVRLRFVRPSSAG